MKKQVIESLRTLSKEWVDFDRETREIIYPIVNPTVIENEDGGVFISAEDGLGWADYYAEFGVEFAPELTKWAEENDVTLEWYNPGSVAVYAN